MYKPTKNGQLYYATPLMAIHTWPSIVHKYKVEEFRRVGEWTYLASREKYLGTLGIYDIFDPLGFIATKRIICDLAIIRSDLPRINAIVAGTKSEGTHRSYVTRARALGMTNFYLTVHQRAFDGVQVDLSPLHHLSDVHDDVFTRYIALCLGLTAPDELQIHPEPLPWWQIRKRIGFAGLRKYDPETGIYAGGLRTDNRMDMTRNLKLRHGYLAPVKWATDDSWDDDQLLDLGVR